MGIDFQGREFKVDIGSSRRGWDWRAIYESTVCRNRRMHIVVGNDGCAEWAGIGLGKDRN